MLNSDPQSKLATFSMFSKPFLAICGVLCLTLAASTASAANGTPVYLRADSRFASSYHQRAWLENRTTDVQIQRWFQVSATAKGKRINGWIAEDHVLTQLRLSSTARLNRDEPNRSAPTLDSLRGGATPLRLPEGTQVVILERSGAWVRARALGLEGPDRNNDDTWILNEALTPDPTDQLEKAYVIQATPVRLHPDARTKPIDRFEPHREVIVLKHGQGKWLEVQIDARNNAGIEIESGWIERQNVWLATDLVDSVRPLFAGLDLKKSPQPNAEVALHLKGTERLTAIGSRYIKWGQVRIPEHGSMWWPILDPRDEALTAEPARTLTTDEVVSRHLFDLAASPVLPGLKLASARGVFKTIDGKIWKQIAQFEEKNYPVAITGRTADKAALFVGPFLSTDIGETFSEWIRWDRLVETIKARTGSPPQRMRLVALEPLDETGRTVRLTLDLDRKAPVIVSTADQGASFRVEPVTP